MRQQVRAVELSRTGLQVVVLPRGCTHRTAVITRTLPFQGALRRDQNPAAHGCVCHVETCCACGAERSINVNQCHVEEGAWGDSLAVRRAKAAAALDAAPAPAKLYARHADSVAYVDADGYVVVTGAVDPRSLPAEWVAQAAAHKAALEAFRALR